MVVFSSFSNETLCLVATESFLTSQKTPIFVVDYYQIWLLFRLDAAACSRYTLLQLELTGGRKHKHVTGIECDKHVYWPKEERL